MKIKIFISHSAADEPLASALVNCLLSCMMLEDDELRCTSVPGHRLPVGSDFTATLLNNIDESAVVIGLITKSAIKSSWVLFELGATWGAKKNLKPLVADEVEFKDLPGPLSGQHAAKLSVATDLAQAIDEVRQIVGAKSRTPAKINKAIEVLIDANSKYAYETLKITAKSEIKTNLKEPVFAGMAYSELVRILTSEQINVPSRFNENKGEVKISLYKLFILNATLFSSGVQSNGEVDSSESFLYNDIGLKLLPYGLVKFEKLLAAQAKFYKRLTVSDEGHKFILHYKKLATKK